MMGGESCGDGDSTPAAKRLPRVCLRRKQGAGALHVTLGQGTVDIQGYALESSSPSATTSPAKSAPANFSVTRVLPGRRDAAAATAVTGSEARFRHSPATPPAAGPMSGRGAAVRDSGLSNVFDAFEREFERFQQEVQHSYLSQGCIDPGQSTALEANRSIAAVAESPGGPCLAEAGPLQPQCRRCGKCSSIVGHGCLAVVRHGLVGATNSCGHQGVAASPRPACQHGTLATVARATVTEHDACAVNWAAAASRTGRRLASAGSTDASANRLRRPSTLPLEGGAYATATVASDESPSSSCTPASDTLSGSVISLFIGEDDEPHSCVDRRLSSETAASAAAVAEAAAAVRLHSCGSAARTCGAAQPAPAKQQLSCDDGCGRHGRNRRRMIAAAVASAGDSTSAAAAACRCGGRRDCSDGCFVAGFDANKFQKLKELAANVELELDLGSFFCVEQPLPVDSSCPPAAPSAASVSYDCCADDELLPSCNYTSHHECVHLVAPGCTARCVPSSPSTATSGTGSGSCNGGAGGGSRAAVAQPLPEQRVPRQASTELHERDDADSGYGGSGGSLPMPQSAGAAAARRGSDPAKAANGGGSEASTDKSSSTVPALARDELCKMIRSYNLRCGSSQLLTMPDGDDVTFSGGIQVCISLSRPISMLLNPRPASIYEVLNRPAAEQRGDEPVAKPHAQQRVTTGKVTVPKDTVLGLHVSSDHVASDVVQMLLGKFKFTDNPRKFALYEQTLVNSVETKLRKLANDERPLVIFLLWNAGYGGSSGGAAQEQRRFVLKEDNSVGSDVNWDAFSVPELLNFLRILEREEKDYVDEIRQKYVARRKHLETALRDAAGGGSGSSGGARSSATSKSRP